MEHQMQEALRNLLEQITWMDEADLDQCEVEVDGELRALKSVNTFDGAGVLTSNAGLVIRMKDGSEFQLSIVQSR